jgi:hypothetical protein
VLASAFAVEAVALWHDRRGHPSAFTAGACVAAAVATDVTTAACALLLASLFSRIARIPRRTTPRLRAFPALAHGGRDGGGARASTRVALPSGRGAGRGLARAVALAGLLGLAAGRRSVAAWRVVVSGLVFLAAEVPSSGGRADVVTRDEEAAMTWIRDHARPLDLVCAPDVPAARWIPAIAGRPRRRGHGAGMARARGGVRGPDLALGAAPAGALPADAPAFRAGQAVVWTGSQGR